MDIPHFVYPFVYWLILGFSYFSVRMSDAPKKRSYLSFCVGAVFISLWCISRSGIAGTCDDTMFEKWPDIFQITCTVLHSQQLSMRVLISLNSHQRLLSDFRNLAILVDVTWYLIVVFVCISLMTNNVESVFSCAHWPWLPYACTRGHLLSCVRLFMTPWTVACKAPLSMEFFRQEYWSGLPFFLL